MNLDTLESLYMDELRDLYDAENQLLKALPKMAKLTSAKKLKEAFEMHLEQTWGHVARIDEIFATLDAKPNGRASYAMKGLVLEVSEILVEEDAEPSIRDAAVIAAAQKIGHYEIASYGTVLTYANLLDHGDASELLQQTLNEESEANKFLNEIAGKIVNGDAPKIRGRV